MSAVLGASATGVRVAASAVALLRPDPVVQAAAAHPARYTCGCSSCAPALAAPAAAAAAAAPAGRSSSSSGAAAARAAAPVTYIDTIKKSGKKSIDALLAGGNRWFHTPGADGRDPASVARTNLTFSFFEDASGLNSMDASGFQTLTSGQRDVVRRALDHISTVVGVTFSEVASGGDIQYGANVQARSAGYARYPNEGSQVFLAANQGSFAGDWEEGSYEWQVILHETAHALGLKHPGNYNAGGGGTKGPYLAKSADHRGNTIMSYHNASNMKRIVYEEGSFQVSQVHAHTLQAYDIAALQYLYGKPASQAVTFSWSEGQAFSQTIWNNHVDSRIDLSNQTLDNILDLRAGKKSSIGIRDPYADMPFTKAEYAKLKSGGRKITSLIGKPTYTGRNNLTIAAGSTINAAIGGSGRDTFIGNGATLNTLDGGAGNDRFFVGKGDAEITGGEGYDVVYLAKKKGYTWRLSEDRTSASLTKRDKATGLVLTYAAVALDGVEQVRLWDGSKLKAVGKALYTEVAAGAVATPARAVA